MPHRPMLALAILTLASVAVLVTWPLPWPIRPLLAVLAAAALAGGLIGRRPHTVRAAGAVWIALSVVERSDWVAPTAAVADRGRVEGIVVVHRTTDRRSWLAVAGLLDTRSTDACRCTTIVRLRAPMGASLEGAQIVAVGSVHRPGPEPAAAVERSWARSRAASFFLNTDRVHVIRPPPVWRSWRSAIRQWLLDQLSNLCSPATTATMYGMITGDRSVVDEALLADAASTGTAHLLAVSGLHVGVIITVMIFLLGGTLYRWWHLALLAVVVTGYIVLTGGEPPAVRAGVMALLVGVARIREQVPDALNLLGVAIIVEVLIWPDAVIRPSFQLSMVVTASLLWLARPFGVALANMVPDRRRWMRRMCSAAGLHLAASVGSALPTAILFDSVSMTAPLVNLLVVPVMSAAFIAALAAIGAAALWPPLGWLMAMSVEIAHTIGIGVISWSAAVTPQVPPPAVSLVAVLTTVAPFWWLRARRLRHVGLRVVLTAALLLAAVKVMHRSTDGVRVVAVGRQLRVEARAGTVQRQCRLGWRSGRPAVTIDPATR